eukprot:g1808.t1
MVHPSSPPPSSSVSSSKRPVSQAGDGDATSIGTSLLRHVASPSASTVRPHSAHSSFVTTSSQHSLQGVSTAGWRPKGKLEPIPKKIGIQSPRAAQQLQLALSYADHAAKVGEDPDTAITALLHVSNGGNIDDLDEIVGPTPSRRKLEKLESKDFAFTPSSSISKSKRTGRSEFSEFGLSPKNTGRSAQGSGRDLTFQLPGLGSRFSEASTVRMENEYNFNQDTKRQNYVGPDEFNAIRAYGESVHTSDEKVTDNIRAGFSELRYRTETVRSNLGGARRQRRRIHSKQMSDIKLTRNALPARFLRINSETFFLERLAETIARVVRAQWFHRWKITCRALYLIERERRRKELLILQKRSAAQLLFKLQFRHFEHYIRKCTKHRFRNWVRKMYHLRKVEMTKSAIKMQSVARGLVIRKAMKLRWDSALWLQRVFRGFRVRKALLLRKSAECLQRTFRLYHKMFWAAIKYQTSFRRWRIRLLFKRKVKAARLIQGMARGIEFRYWRLMAALCMQPWWREILKRRHRTAEMIQARYRAHFQRMKYLRCIHGTIVFESFVRMKIQRIKFLVKLAEYREMEAKRKALIKEKRRMKKLAFLYREARKICGHTYTITITNKSSDFILLVAYRPATCKSFEFVVKKTTFMKIPQKQAKKGKIVDADKLYERLIDRLTERKVFGEIVLRLKRHGRGERGVRMMRRVTSVMGHRYVVSIYKWLGSWVFVAYNPVDQEHLRCQFSSHHVHTWLNWSPSDPSPPELLRPGNRYELLVWMCTQLILRKHPNPKLKGKQQLLLKPQLRQENNACKIQCMVRARLARSRARRQAHKVVRKIRDAESKQFFYKYTNTDLILWHKPRVLHDMDDIECPDKWERTRDEFGQVVYFNPLSGKYSRISPHDAAVAMQKKFRQSRGAEFRLEFHQLVKALKMIKTTEEKYKLFPNNLPVIVNYALYQHTIVGDYNKAREMYEKALKVSSHNPVILYGYGLLMLMGNFYPRKKYYMVALDQFEKARLMDEQRTAMVLAKQSFFHWAVVSQPQNARAMANYGLYHQYIEGHHYKAGKYLRRAINIDPDDEAIIACWDEYSNPDNVLTASERKLFDNPKTRDYMFQVAETQGQAEIDARKERMLAVQGKELQEEEVRIADLTAKGRGGDGLRLKPPDKNVKVVLDSLGVGTYFYQIGDLGIETVADMQLLEKDDLVALGMKKIQIRKLLKRLKLKDPVAASMKKQEKKKKSNSNSKPGTSRSWNSIGRRSGTATSASTNVTAATNNYDYNNYYEQTNGNQQLPEEKEKVREMGEVRSYFVKGKLCKSEKWNEAAKRLQGLFRTRKARFYLQTLVASIYEKLWDEENQCYYYVNNKTGESSWNKPKALGSSDLRDSSYDYY